MQTAALLSSLCIMFLDSSIPTPIFPLYSVQMQIWINLTSLTSPIHHLCLNSKMPSLYQIDKATNVVDSIFEKGIILHYARVISVPQTHLDHPHTSPATISSEYYHYSNTFLLFLTVPLLSLSLFIFTALLYTVQGHSFLQVATIGLQNSFSKLSSAFTGQFSSFQPCNKAFELEQRLLCSM